jgi:glycosyltransferase involved in cell wall biosynthesis
MRTGMLSIVIPVYNESLLIQSSVERIMRVTDFHRIKIQFIIVDDGSQDATWEVLQRLSDSYRQLHAIQLSRNF